MASVSLRLVFGRALPLLGICYWWKKSREDGQQGKRQNGMDFCFVFCPAVHIVVLEYIHLFIVSILVY